MLAIAFTSWAAQAQSLNLHQLADKFKPFWHFYPGTKFYPVDLEQHLNPSVPMIAWNDRTNRAETLPMHRRCDGGHWRLEYRSKSEGQHYRHVSYYGKTYAFIEKTLDGYDIHYLLYYPYNVGNNFVTAYDHWGDWERATVHLQWTGQQYKPWGLTTQAHGNVWFNAWDSDDVWTYGNTPRVFVAENSNGTYPNTNNERGIFDHPTEGSHNRTCVDKHPSIYCDYIAGDGIGLSLAVEAIEVGNQTGENYQYGTPSTFTLLDQNGNARSAQPQWLNTNTSCANEGQTVSSIGPINRWGNSSHAGGPDTPLVKQYMARYVSGHLKKCDFIGPYSIAGNDIVDAIIKKPPNGTQGDVDFVFDWKNKGQGTVHVKDWSQCKGKIKLPHNHGTYDFKLDRNELTLVNKQRFIKAPQRDLTGNWLSNGVVAGSFTMDSNSNFTFKLPFSNNPMPGYYIDKPTGLGFQYFSNVNTVLGMKVFRCAILFSNGVTWTREVCE